MSAALRIIPAFLVAIGGLALAAGSAEAVQVKNLPAPAPRPVPQPAPRPLPAPAPGGGGGGTVGTGTGQALPPLAWYELEPGLARGQKEKKPVVVVFTTRAYRGPGTFDSNVLRDALTRSAAVPVRVLPPEVPTVPAKAGADERKAAEDKYQEAMKKYRELATKYGASANPTLIFLTPGAEALGQLVQPGAPEVGRWLSGLPAAVKAFGEEGRRGRPAETRRRRQVLTRPLLHRRARRDGSGSLRTNGLTLRSLR